MGRRLKDDVPALVRARVQALLAANERITKRSACRGICSPTTLYEHDERLPADAKLSTHIAAKEAERLRVAGRVARRRGGAADAARIAALETEAAEWRGRYETVLERLTLLEHRLRDRDVDVNAIYRDGLVQPDRSVNRSGGTGDGVGRRGSLRVG